MIVPAQLLRISEPVTQGLLLAVIGLLWLILRRHRLGITFIGLGLLWVTACATPAFAGLLLRGLEQKYPPQSVDTYPVVDAIVVLGGGRLPPLGDAGNPKQLATTRLGFAMLLYADKRAPMIVLSGGEGSAIAMNRRLQEFGVPAAALRTDSRSLNTYQNAEFSTALVKREGLQRILLVTSPDHMPRSVISFEGLGLEVIPAADDERHPRLDLPKPWLPQPSVLRLSERILHEYIGLCVYKIRRWA
jgi:uncharacterized SAM-binding protein YcdF (DUF218 family)